MDCKSFWRQDQFNGNTMHPESFKVVDHFYAEYDNDVYVHPSGTSLNLSCVMRNVNREQRTHAIIYSLRYSTTTHLTVQKQRWRHWPRSRNYVILTTADCYYT